MNTTVGPHRLAQTDAEVILGDITRLPGHYDVIASSDDNYLSAGGGVSAAVGRDIVTGGRLR
jgi:O-acetyl-ADP-ribose deacetylase (regulator of RNase III)